MKRIKLKMMNSNYGMEIAELFFGSASEIKAMYNSIWRNKNNRFDFCFTDKAKFNLEKSYGLLIHENLTIDVLMSDTVLMYLAEGVFYYGMLHIFLERPMK